LNEPRRASYWIGKERDAESGLAFSLVGIPLCHWHKGAKDRKEAIAEELKQDALTEQQLRKW
jgi:hypothetical protein